MDTTQKNREQPRNHPAGAKERQRPRPQEQPPRRRPARPEEPSASRRPNGERSPRPQRSEPNRDQSKASAQRRQPPRRRASAVEDVPQRRRAYGNSKPRKKNKLQQAAELVTNFRQQVADDPKTKARREQREKKRQQAKKQINAPAVIYTQAKPFNRDRLIIQMTTVAAVVLAVVLALSVFFKVDNITVSGAEVYSAWAVREASGISEGDNLLTFSKIRAAGQIMAKLPYVEKVRIGIKLPDTVNIMVKEASVVYAIKSSDGTWWLMDSDGRIIEQTTSAVADSTTKVLGVTLEQPAPNKQATATETTQVEETGEGEPQAPVSTTGAQRLRAALQILAALEANDLVGEAASLDVTSLEEIILWYGTRYQVNLGNSDQLETKITWMNDAILQLSDYQTGVLDISFTIWPDRVVYTPFE